MEPVASVLVLLQSDARDIANSTARPGLGPRLFCWGARGSTRARS